LAFGPSSLIKLEMECREFEAKMPYDLEYRIELKALSAQMCLLGAAVVRTALLLDPKIRSALNEHQALQSAVTVSQVAHRSLALDLTLIRDVPLYELATLMWSVSYPYEQRVFLSQRGPDYRSILIKKLNDAGFLRSGKHPGAGPLVDVSGERWTNRSDKDTAASFFLDAMVAPNSETCRGFVWRELWESTHLHAFVTKNYFNSDWCLAELRLWRIITSLQSWRTISYTIVDSDTNDISSDLLNGRMVNENWILHSEELKTIFYQKMNQNNGDYLLAIYQF
jgi:hypothetical protein